MMGVEKRLDRREFIRRGAGGAAAAALGASALGATSWDADRPPNIIYIMADDLGYGDLGCYGQEKIETPHVDRMASQGMKFTDHYAPCTVCAPTRGSLMTGKHIGHAYIRGNKPVQPLGQYPLKDEAVTVAEMLQDAGYVTGCTGKWGLGPPDSEGAPQRQGFDYFFGYNCQRNAHFYYPPFLWENDEKVPLPGNEGDSEEQYSHDVIADRALDFIRRNADRPFFLYGAFTIPHAELVVPQDSLEKYKGRFPEEPFDGGSYHYRPQKYPRATYAGMVTRLDRDVGRILDLLAELGIERETLVIFTSDNGPHEEGGNDPAFFNSNGPFRGIKRDLYEGGIRMPFIARWPGVIQPGTRSDHISAHYDLMPTAAELAGVEPPKDTDGISYVPELLGRRQRKHDYLYWQYGDTQAARDGRWKALRRNVRSRGFDASVELYDLQNDIGEQNDVADEHPEVCERMKNIMTEAHAEPEVFRF
ncbi:MAG: arylsulfatase [Planctomycetota bacterium]